MASSACLCAQVDGGQRDVDQCSECPSWALAQHAGCAPLAEGAQWEQGTLRQGAKLQNHSHNKPTLGEHTDLWVPDGKLPFLERTSGNMSGQAHHTEVCGA